MSLQFPLDQLDRSIIGLLGENGRLSAAEIATRLGEVSERTVRNRIATLLQNRQIVIGAIPDPAALGKEVQAELLLEVQPGKVGEVAARLAEYEQVYYLAALSGEFSLSVSVFLGSDAELLDFVDSAIGQIPGVRRVVSNVVLRLYKAFGTRTTALDALTAGEGA